jgi:hypothetical protein
MDDDKRVPVLAETEILSSAVILDESRSGRELAAHERLNERYVFAFK